MTPTPAVAFGRGTEDPPPSTVSLDAYLAPLRRHRRWLVAGALAGFLGGLAYGLTRPAMYQATATLLIARSKMAAQTEPVPVVAGLRAFVANQNLVARVLTTFGLDKPPMRLTPATFVASHLVVNEVIASNLLFVRVSLPDAKLAADVTNRLVGDAVELSRRVNTEESLAVRDFLMQQLGESRRRMEELERTLLDFKTGAQVELRREEVKSLLAEKRRLVELQVQLEGERARLQRAELELRGRSRVLPAPRRPNQVASITSPPPTVIETPAPEAVDAPPPANSQAPAQPPPQLTDTPPTPKVERSDPGRAWLAEGGTSTMIDPVYELLEYEAASSRTKVAELERHLRELSERYKLTGATLRQLTELYSREIRLARLEAEYKLASDVYADIFGRHEQARIQVASRSTELRVVDPALVPTESLTPSPLVVGALGAIFGLGSAALLILFAGYLAPAPKRLTT